MRGGRVASLAYSEGRESDKSNIQWGEGEWQVLHTRRGGGVTSLAYKEGRGSPSVGWRETIRACCEGATQQYSEGRWNASVAGVKWPSKAYWECRGREGRQLKGALEMEQLKPILRGRRFKKGSTQAYCVGAKRGNSSVQRMNATCHRFGWKDNTHHSKPE